jgi:hypothetical protein
LNLTILLITVLGRSTLPPIETGGRRAPLPMFLVFFLQGKQRSRLVGTSLLEACDLSEGCERDSELPNIKACSGATRLDANDPKSWIDLSKSCGFKTLRRLWNILRKNAN